MENRRRNNQNSISGSMGSLFTGTPVNVRVEEVTCTKDEYITYKIHNLSDFDSLDFYLPLVLLAFIFVLQFGFGSFFIVVFLQIVLFRDLYSRVKRRPSGRLVTGLHPPGLSESWRQAFLIYFACLPAILGAIWLNLKLTNKLFPEPALNEMEMDPAGQTASMLSTLIAIGIIAIILEFFVTVVLAPITEELWFRGIGLASLTKTHSIIYAVITTSVIFGALHGPGRIVFATVFGLVMALIRYRTGSLYCCMAVHALHNFGVLVIGIYLLIRSFSFP